MDPVSETPDLDDSDDELPDIFSSKGNEDKHEIASRDIVWAEFRKLYWPALVRSVYKKDKKASVWYLDSPKKCFKVPFSKIKSFNDPKMTAMIRQEVERSPMKALHKKVYFNVITYIRRQSEGYQDDPAAYFDLSQPYLAFQGLKFANDDDKNSEINMSEALQGEMDDASRDSDEESLVDSEEEESQIVRKLSMFHDVEDSNEDDPQAEEILKYITEGRVDKYLLQIKAKKVASNYQKLFEAAIKTDRRNLFDVVTACDIIKSLSKLREISYYLMNFYEKVIEGGKCEMVDYITSVWLPEAINKAAESLKEGPAESEDSNMPESSTRRKLFPTDKLVNMEISDPITLSMKNKNKKSNTKSSVKLCKRKQRKNTQVSGDTKNSTRCSKRLKSSCTELSYDESQLTSDEED